MYNVTIMGNGLRLKREEKTAPKECPWLVDGPVQRGIIGLDAEIRLFYDFLSPTREDRLMRQEIVDNIAAVMTHHWPDIKFKVFGSVDNELYFPWSDIDLACIHSWKQVPFSAICEILESSRLVGNVRCFDKAIVPIIRTFHRTTRIQIDISFRIEVGSFDPTKQYMQQYPDLKYIVYVVKYLLSYFNLNEVYTGGLSSYAVVLLVVHFFKTNTTRANNLGVVLIEFLHLFGCVFNYRDCGISLHDGYFVKSRIFLKTRLCLIDPNNERNDITKGSFNIASVFKLFENAFYYLNEAVSPANVNHSGTILGQLFKLRESHLSFIESTNH